MSEDMEIKTTTRGFRYIEFEDRDGKKCTLQESSLAEEAAVRFGVDDENENIVRQGPPWRAVDLPPDTSVFSRMHLTQDQVAQLLPVLINFVKTGYVEAPSPMETLAAGTLEDE